MARRAFDAGSDRIGTRCRRTWPGLYQRVRGFRIGRCIQRARLTPATAGVFSDKVLVGAPRPGSLDGMNSKPRIAHISGSNATISGSPPLVTSNKAREKRGLPLLEDRSGARLRFDALRPQRLAAPVTVYVEQFSAHPLERDAAELYGPPDGYVDRAGVFHRQRQSRSDVPVYEIALSPDD